MTGADDDAEVRKVSRRTWLGSTISRRSILTTTPLAAVGGLALAACTTDAPTAVVAEGDVRVPERPPTPPTELPQTLRFFTAEEAQTVETAAARIFPGSPDDPGAVEAGVLRYIDTKLADHETYAEPTYQDGPFANEEGGPEVPEDQLYRYGPQSSQTPRETYRLGVPALDRYSQTRFGSLFRELDEQGQDDVLAVLDAVQQRSEPGDLPAGEGEDPTEMADTAGGAGQPEEVTEEQMDQAEEIFGDLDPGQFFSTLRTDTIEGMFCDPAYGGNAGMVGWALLGYPGAQRSYSPHDMMHGSEREPQPMHQLTAMNPDRPGGHPALEQPGQHGPGRDGGH